MPRGTPGGGSQAESVLLLISGAFGLLAPAASADSAPLDPASPTSPVTVTADPLPTVQIDGVAWAQIVVGNTVYVAGKFATARPAGAAAGTRPRSATTCWPTTSAPVS